MQHIVKIKALTHVTHDVIQVVTEKPADYTFHPGQATDVAINKEGWKDELRPFTFTSLPQNDYLEFNIKTYPSHEGVTNQLRQLGSDDELILHDVFGDIDYKGEGLFIAGGAGITPFLAILRHLHSKNELGDNKLIFANKTKADIIHEAEFKKMLGQHFINVLSDEQIDGYDHGYITEATIRNQIAHEGQYFYVCGPPPMMDAVEKHLAALKIAAEFIVKEGF